MADVVRGSVLLTPRFDNLTGSMSKALNGAFGSSKAAREAGSSSAGLFGDGFAAKVGGIAGLVSSVASKAMDVVSSSIGSAVSRVDTMNAFPKVLAGLGYSATDADAAVGKMSQHLTGLPTRLDAMTSSVQKIVPTVKDVGKSTDIMLAFNDALLAGGASTDVQQAALEQFTQVLSKGKPELEDWRSIQQAMPGQLDQVAKSLLGPTAGSNELYQAMKDGKVTVGQLEDAFVSLDSQGLDGFDSFATQAKNGTSGIATSFANLQNSVVKGVAGIIQAIGPEAITGPMQAATSLISQASGAVAQGVSTAKDWLAQLWQAFVPTVDLSPLQLAGGYISSIADSAQGVLGGLASLAEQFASSGAAAAVLDAGLDAVNGALGVVQAVFSAACDWVGQFLQALQDNGAMQSFSDAVGAVGDALQSMGDFVGNVLDDLLQLATDSGSAQGAADLLKDALDGVKGVADALGGAFDTLDQNLGAVEPVIVAVATALAGIKVAEGVTGAVSALGDLGAAADLAKQAVQGGSGVFQAVSDAIGALGSDAGPAVSALGSVSGKLAEISSAAADAGGGITGLSTALGLGPWGLVAVAIAAVVAGLVWFFTQTEVGQQAWQAFTDFLGQAAQAVCDTVTSAFQAVADFVTQTVPQALSDVGTFVSGIPATIAGLLSQVPGAMASLMATVGEAVTTGLSTLGQLLLTFLASLPTLLATGVGFIVGFVAGLAATLLQLVVTGVATLAQAVVSGLQALPGALAGLLATAVATVASWAAQLASWAVQAGTQFLSNVTTFFSQLPGALAGLLAAAVSAIASWASQVASQAQQAGSQFVSNVQSFFSQLPGAIAGLLASAISSIGGFVSSCASSAQRAGQGFLSGIQGGFNTAVSFVTGIPGRIRGIFSGAGSWLLSSGRALLDGFTQGIRNGFAAAQSAVSSGLSAIRSFFPFSPAKRGPFSGRGYTTFSGRALMGGLAEGIGRGTELARTAAADALADVRGAMTAAPLSFAAAAAPYARAGSAALAPQAGEAGAGTSYVVNFNGATVNESSAIDARIEQFVVDLHRMGALYG